MIFRVQVELEFAVFVYEVFETLANEHHLASDDHRFQQRGFKITQVHAMHGTGLRFKRLPMGDDAADLAAHVFQGSIAPDVAFRVLRVALDGN